MHSVQKIIRALHQNHPAEVIALVEQKMHSRDALLEIKPILSDYITHSMTEVAFQPSASDAEKELTLGRIRDLYLRVVTRMHEQSEKAVMEMDWPLPVTPSLNP